MNTTTWPSVSPKNNAEVDKLPNDYYPSLDELQHSDRKVRQHNFVQQGGSQSLDKPPSPTLPKSKTSPDSNKKTEAQEEAISKVVKYVQDIEKMQQSQLQQESKQSSNNSSPNSNETTPTNPLPPKLPESLPNPSFPLETETSNVGESNKDSNASSKSSGARIRKNHLQSTNSGTREYSSSQMQVEDARDAKKVQNLQPEEVIKLANSPSQSLQDDKDSKKNASVHNTPIGLSDSVDLNKSRVGSSVKPVQPSRTVVDTETVRVNKTERLPKAIKDPQPINLKDSSKVSYPQQVIIFIFCQLKKFTF